MPATATPAGIAQIAALGGFVNFVSSSTHYTFQDLNYSLLSLSIDPQIRREHGWYSEAFERRLLLLQETVPCEKHAFRIKLLQLFPKCIVEHICLVLGYSSANQRGFGLRNLDFILVFAMYSKSLFPQLSLQVLLLFS